MTTLPIQELVRHFPENSAKFLLQNGANTRDLLHLVEEPTTDELDFARQTVERTHFVQPDFEHVLADLLLRVPLRGGPPGSAVCVYFLIEHAVRPRRFTLLQVGEYLWEIYKMQKRAWDERHASDARFSLEPVIPVVFYTGDRAWERPAALVDVIRDGPRFRPRIPDFEPHFLNLREQSPEDLKSKGSFFGQVLYLLQQRDAPLAEFRQVLREVLEELGRMPAAQRQRWLDFFVFIHALVYHARSPDEREVCREVIAETVEAGPHRKESKVMARTIADALKDEGRVEGQLASLQETLVRQIRKRFKKVPRKVESRIRATTDVPTLETWLDNFVDAETLDAVGVPLD